MRIGIDCRFYSSAFTGIGRYVHELVQNLAAIDSTNKYFLFFNEPQFEEFEAPSNQFAKVLCDVPHYSFREQWKLHRILSQYHLDLMHFTHFNAPILYRRPCIVTIHDLTLSVYPGKKMKGLLHRIAYNIVIRSISRRARKIISVSEHTKKDIIRFLKIPEQKIKVIHIGVAKRFHKILDEHLLAKFRQQRGLLDPYILYTGVWRSHKNLVNLVRAFSILKHKLHFNGKLVISGKEDPWYPEVRQAVAKEHLEGEVRFTGYVPDEDLVLLYNCALVYVMPSLYEGFGLPVLEAFACGTPVCASRTSALPEVCGKENAVFFNPHDPQDMAEQIASVALDKARQEELRARGFDRVKAFSWEKMARETLEIYKIAR